MNDDEADVVKDFLKGSSKPKINLIDVDYDDERDIFFRDKDEKTHEESFFTAIIVPAGTADVDKWWVSGDRVKELLELLELLDIDMATYTWRDKKDKGDVIWFNCKNRKKWTAASIIKDYIALRLAKLNATLASVESGSP